MSHCSQTICRLSRIFIERRHLENLYKSANIFIKNKKFKTMMKNKSMILTLIYLQMTIEKCAPKHLISSL